MRDALLEHYDRALPLLRARGEALQAEVAALLASIEGLKVHSVTLRLKSRESLTHKLGRPDRSYRSLWAITDLVGVRVIVYFEEAVERIGQLVESNLAVDFAHSIDKRRRDATTFGYRSLHYVCRLGATPRDAAAPSDGAASSDRAAPREAAAPLALPPEARYEIQVRTVLEHAWAEIEHDLGYKAESAVPSSVQRRLHRLAGLLELADQEFGAIRNDLLDYARVLPERIASASDSVPLDRLSLGALLDCSEVRDLDRAIAIALDKELGEEPFFPDYLLRMLASSGIRSVGEARAGVARHAAVIASMVRPYFAFAWQTWRLSPEQMERVFRGYSLFFLAHAEVLGSPALGIDKVERLAHLYRELDYPDDEDAAQRVASRLVDAFGEVVTAMAAKDANGGR
jgi:ppGpp synthetase/RelA/SpoT-type nucleotidyltranferase